MQPNLYSLFIKFSRGGGTSILKVSGTCRWTGYDFAIIAIKTGCLNQPNPRPNHWHRVSKSAYLATGTDYSVYHRVASSAHNVYDRSAISAPTRRVGACGTSIPTILFFFFYEQELIHMKIIFIEFVLL